jgi:hypothetical protein
LAQFRAQAGLCLGLALLLGACGDDSSNSGAYPRDGELRLNHIQVVGSHNSYHIRPQGRVGRAFPIEAWQYDHLPLDQQFTSQGVRQIELDIFADPAGGLYATPAAAVRLNEPFDVPALQTPGFKTLHIQDLDYQSTCWTFVECLVTVRDWSDANPGHAPLAILVEVKDEEVPITLPGLDFVVPIQVGPEELDALDAEILSVFPEEQIITPDEVRGERETLAEAIEHDGWPTLGDSRGRVIFLLDNGGGIKADYVAGHPSLRGRVLFTSSGPGEAEAAFLKLNDSFGDFDQIQEAVAAGYIVRTRADGDTVEARTNDTRRRDAAIASGAQFVSSDYPAPDPDFGTGYFVQIPGGMPAACNPISAPTDCDALDIENPAALR